jgi:hypothetical protein
MKILPSKSAIVPMAVTVVAVLFAVKYIPWLKAKLA